MVIAEGLEALVVFALVICTLLFLLALQRGSLTERQQTCAWLCFTALFLGLCGVAVRGRDRQESSTPVPFGLEAATQVR